MTLPAELDELAVSRETIQRLEAYEKLLRLWQKKMNLISRSTVEQIWSRHFADSLQLLLVAPEARTWVDIGSGAGFPGLPIAIHLAEGFEGGTVHLIERDHRKCSFLREVIRVTSAKAEVHCGDAASIIPGIASADIVTSRAVAPIASLVNLASSLLERGAVGMFLKGQHIDAELTVTAISSSYKIDKVPSRTGSGGNLVIVRHALAF